ncbi:MAG: replication factor C small subunit, partial [Faunusvirus sp.]
RNIKKMFWLLEMKFYNIGQGVGIDNYKQKIVNIVKFMINGINKTVTEQHFVRIRDELYNIFITNINSTTIIRDLLKEILRKTPGDFPKFELVELTSKYENRISQGKRSVLHIEAYINNVMLLMYKYAKK